MTTAQTHPAFTDEQVAMLRTLLSAKTKAEAAAREKEKARMKAKKKAEARKERKANKKKVLAEAKVKKTTAPTAPLIRLAPGASENLVMRDEHRLAAERGDYTWVPPPQSDNHEYMTSRRITCDMDRAQLVLLGHIHWTRRHNGAQLTDTVITGNRLAKVSITKVDSAIEYAFGSTRLAWTATTEDGQVAAWHPVAVRITEPDPKTGARHLHLGAVSGQYRAINTALRTGVLSLCVKAQEQIKNKPKRDAPQGKAKASIKPNREKALQAMALARRKPSGGHREDSSMIPARESVKVSRRAPIIHSGPGPSAEKAKSASHIEICPRCSGGELFNCPKCDGTGFLKVFEEER